MFRKKPRRAVSARSYAHELAAWTENQYAVTTSNQIIDPFHLDHLANDAGLFNPVLTAITERYEDVVGNYVANYPEDARPRESWLGKTLNGTLWLTARNDVAPHTRMGNEGIVVSRNLNAILRDALRGSNDVPVNTDDEKGYVLTKMPATVVEGQGTVCLNFIDANNYIEAGVVTLQTDGSDTLTSDVYKKGRWCEGGVVPSGDDTYARPHQKPFETSNDLLSESDDVSSWMGITNGVNPNYRPMENLSDISKHVGLLYIHHIKDGVRICLKEQRFKLPGHVFLTKIDHEYSEWQNKESRFNDPAEEKGYSSIASVAAYSKRNGISLGHYSSTDEIQRNQNPGTGNVAQHRIVRSNEHLTFTGPQDIYTIGQIDNPSRMGMRHGSGHWDHFGDVSAWDHRYHQYRPWLAQDFTITAWCMPTQHGLEVGASFEIPSTTDTDAEIRTTSAVCTDTIHPSDLEKSRYSTELFHQKHPYGKHEIRTIHRTHPDIPFCPRVGSVIGNTHDIYSYYPHADKDEELISGSRKRNNNSFTIGARYLDGIGDVGNFTGENSLGTKSKTTRGHLDYGNCIFGNGSGFSGGSHEKKFWQSPIASYKDESGPIPVENQIATYCGAFSAQYQLINPGCEVQHLSDISPFPKLSFDQNMYPQIVVQAGLGGLWNAAAWRWGRYAHVGQETLFGIAPPYTWETKNKLINYKTGDINNYLNMNDVFAHCDLRGARSTYPYWRTNHTNFELFDYISGSYDFRHRDRETVFTAHQKTFGHDRSQYRANLQRWFGTFDEYGRSVNKFVPQKLFPALRTVRIAGKGFSGFDIGQVGVQYDPMFPDDLTLDENRQFYGDARVELQPMPPWLDQEQAAHYRVPQTATRLNWSNLNEFTNVEDMAGPDENETARPKNYLAHHLKNLTLQGSPVDATMNGLWSNLAKPTVGWFGRRVLPMRPNKQWKATGQSVGSSVLCQFFGLGTNLDRRFTFVRQRASKGGTELVFRCSFSEIMTRAVMMPGIPREFYLTRDDEGPDNMTDMEWKLHVPDFDPYKLDGVDQNEQWIQCPKMTGIETSYSVEIDLHVFSERTLRPQGVTAIERQLNWGSTNLQQHTYFASEDAPAWHARHEAESPLGGGLYTGYYTAVVNVDERHKNPPGFSASRVNDSGHFRNNFDENELISFIIKDDSFSFGEPSENDEGDKEKPWRIIKRPANQVFDFQSNTQRMYRGPQLWKSISFCSGHLIPTVREHFRSAMHDLNNYKKHGHAVDANMVAQQYRAWNIGSGTMTGASWKTWIGNPLENYSRGGSMNGSERLHDVLHLYNNSYLRDQFDTPDFVKPDRADTFWYFDFANRIYPGAGETMAWVKNPWQDTWSPANNHYSRYRDYMALSEDDLRRYNLGWGMGKYGQKTNQDVDTNHFTGWDDQNRSSAFLSPTYKEFGYENQSTPPLVDSSSCIVPRWMFGNPLMGMYNQHSKAGMAPADGHSWRHGHSWDTLNTAFSNAEARTMRWLFHHFYGGIGSISMTPEAHAQGLYEPMFITSSGHF